MGEYLHWRSRRAYRRRKKSAVDLAGRDNSCEILAGRMYVLTRGRGLGGDNDRVQVLIAHQCAHDIIILAVASKMDE